MNWEGLIAFVYGLIFFWGTGNVFFKGRLGSKRLGPGQITRASNPFRYWTTLIGVFVASIVCFSWAYTQSRYGAYLGIRSLTSFFPLKLS